MRLSAVRIVVLTVWVWAVFLWYGPVAIFLAIRFHWQISEGSVTWLYWPGVISALSAFGTGLVLVFVTPWRMIVPFLLFTASAVIIFSSLGDFLFAKSFADYIKPEAAYVRKHCAPMDFVQDDMEYVFGICGLKLDGDGQMTDFDFIYDTSGDVENYASLPRNDKLIFVAAVRKYLNDDPNDAFEIADFTTTRFYRSFFYVAFDEANAEGFTRDFGMPPRNLKNPYPPIFQDYPK